MRVRHQLLARRELAALFVAGLAPDVMVGRGTVLAAGNR